MRAAPYTLHVVSDWSASAGVMIAGAMVHFTGWWQADPAVSFVHRGTGDLWIVGG